MSHLLYEAGEMVHWVKGLLEFRSREPMESWVPQSTSEVPVFLSEMKGRDRQVLEVYTCDQQRMAVSAR